jgi:L-amino acid N-acyltransferase YncA|tara:strand:+ start:115 stop:264 length:150 start_codon:yes stop_codon:yes gene_type:complete
MLYADVIGIAKKKGYKKVVIDIFEENKRSLGFHDKLGFKPLYTIYQKKL